ncbi:very-long-chain enoyl-CoA reductase-like isoform X2 [Crotalus tigris]|uniref:very-long-chain enoyl-CoA reductase-like isoform X2 n=1 Tax=Crotalus tigris TaxID=88082 RepID=UPI00192F9124|nr:very-long-chain enoyl-CoA reductase-like isoform X2 [Crotalus tigris]
MGSRITFFEATKHDIWLCSDLGGHTMKIESKSGEHIQHTFLFLFSLQQPLGEVEILDWKTKQQLCFLEKVEPHTTISDIQAMLHKIYPQWYPARQSIRLDPKGKSLKNEEILQLLPFGTTATLYFKDLGPQIGWTMVFLIEYTGPLFIYFVFYLRMPFIYGQDDRFTSGRHPVVKQLTYPSKYVKDAFGYSSIQLQSTSKLSAGSGCENCFYYWGFAAWLAFYINHPLYTPPYYGQKQVNFALIMFLTCEAGNFSIHVTLSNLRRDGKRSKTCKIPYPTKNPFTWLFYFVSCPNYTYELGTWIGFTIMTQCVSVGLFTLLCFIQMTVWAKDKHGTYIREFKDYPSFRMSIIPFLL